MTRTRVTSRDVAARAGVSRTTVSFVLNNTPNTKVSAATRERVFRAARELGYVPDAAARTLVSGRTGSIGLVVSYASHIRIDAFVSQALHGLMQICNERNYRLLVETAEIGARPYDFDQLVSAKQIDGLVVLNPDPEDSHLQALIETGFPLVLLGGHPDPRVAAVFIDTSAGMEVMASHLIDHGHERVGFIHYRQSRSMGEGGRFGGYRRALAAAGLPFDASLVRFGDYGAESGYVAMASLLREPDRPTAVVAGNDTIATGAISAIWEAGLHVPHDIAVVGFDDIPNSRFTTPALTTVHVPAWEMARRCGEMAIDLINGVSLERLREQVPTEMIIRASCGSHGELTGSDRVRFE